MSSERIHNLFGGSRKGAKQHQEDSYCMMRTTSGPFPVTMGCVFDGHGGVNGMIASNTARNVAEAFFAEKSHLFHQWGVDEWRSALTRLFQQLHDTIRSKFVEFGDEKRTVDHTGNVRNPGGDPVHGGTTATIVVETTLPSGGVVLITANVGDSTAVLLPRRPLSKTNVTFLTVDHGPESQEEWRRVQALTVEHKLLFVYDKQNVFRKYECPLVFLPDGTKDQRFVANPWGNGLHPTNVRYEPAVYAVTPKNVTRDSTCIAMTRALGDFYAQQFGLTPEPFIGVTPLDSNLEYSVVVASDGVWDCWKWEEFLLFVNDRLAKVNDPAANVHEVGDSILKESIDRALANFGAKHFDDAAVVMWCAPASSRGFQSPSQPSSSSSSSSAQPPSSPSSQPPSQPPSQPSSLPPNSPVPSSGTGCQTGVHSSSSATEPISTPKQSKSNTNTTGNPSSNPRHSPQSRSHSHISPLDKDSPLKMDDDDDDDNDLDLPVATITTNPSTENYLQGGEGSGGEDSSGVGGSGGGNVSLGSGGGV